ncbi:hypothetical protein SDC9_184965 [bioreactor metagenome]|uniref:Uncharacterized protein n=1 Tax=bioreactor metagenome TaxID=1076179 RepID=A0A645HFV2_9ZZZZ
MHGRNGGAFICVCTQVKDLRAQPLGVGLQTGFICQRSLALGNECLLNFRKKVSGHKFRLQDHGSPMPAVLVVDAEIVHIWSPPQPLQPHGCVIDGLGFLDVELQPIGEAVQGLNSLLITLAGVGVPLAIDHQILQRRYFYEGEFFLRGGIQVFIYFFQIDLFHFLRPYN